MLVVRISKVSAEVVITNMGEGSLCPAQTRDSSPRSVACSSVVPAIGRLVLAIKIISIRNGSRSVKDHKVPEEVQQQHAFIFVVSTSQALVTVGIEGSS